MDEVIEREHLAHLEERPSHATDIHERSELQRQIARSKATIRLRAKLSPVEF